MIPQSYRFQLLAPYFASSLSEQTAGSPNLYADYLGSLQRLRGEAYLRDGAIKPSQLDEFGRHRMDDDELCWHFILIGPQEQAIGCARYLLHPFGAFYDKLRVSRSPLAQDAIWGGILRQAMEETLQKTRNEKIRYAELGGWAIAEEYRSTKAALEILLASYLWGEMIGHCICTCTATSRNNSASILRRMGATSLTHNGRLLPPYFDAQYGCNMEILRFDSRQLPARFGPLLCQMRSKLTQNPIIHCSHVEDTNTVVDLVNLQRSLLNGLAEQRLPLVSASLGADTDPNTTRDC